jgi:hypothetical protein
VSEGQSVRVKNAKGRSAEVRKSGRVERKLENQKISKLTREERQQRLKDKKGYAPISFNISISLRKIALTGVKFWGQVFHFALLHLIIQ